MPPVSTAAVVLAYLLDLAIHEFPERYHPVVWYGTMLDRVDCDWNHPRLAGVVGAAVLPVVAGTIVGLATAIGGAIHVGFEIIVAGGVLFASTSLRMLVDNARSVVEQSVVDPETARDQLPALVGRNPAGLSREEIRSAAVESAAENLADGLVAPLLAFVLFSWSLPLAAGAAATIKAINTGDSMFGYRTVPVGWAFARLDDVVMWIPARLSALLLAVSGRDLGAVRRARRWVRLPPSPNAGWPMATVAAVLDVGLEKPSSYSLNPTAVLPTPTEAHRGIRIVHAAGTLAFVAAAAVAWS